MEEATTNKPLLEGSPPDSARYTENNGTDNNTGDTTATEVQGGTAKFEQIFIWIRPLGYWQLLVLLYCAYAQFATTFVNLEVIFYGVTPTFECDPRIDGITDQWWSFEQIANLTSPLKPGSTSERDSCLIRQVNFSQFSGSDYNEVKRTLAQMDKENKTKFVKCEKWLYDRSAMTETVVTQWDLVCDNMWWVEHGVSLNFFGFLLGVLIAGFLSDTFGRKMAALITCLVYVPTGLACSIAPNYLVFMILRTIAMMGAMGNANVVYCYGLEIVGSQYRSIVGGLFFIPYAIAYVAIAGLAAVVSDWRYLNLVCLTTGMLQLVITFFVPESPRWLLVKGRVDQATRVLITAARVNKAQLPKNVNLGAVAEAIQKEEKAKKQNTESIISMFKYPVLVLRAIIVYFEWAVIAMVYYGLSLNVSSFAGNIFINNAISGAIEIPAYAASYGMLYLGRKPATYLTLFVCAASLIAIAFITNATWIMVLAMCGKFAVTIAFSVIYVLTVEIYPTVIRNFGLSTSSAVGRVGTMVAPYISGISKLGASMTWVPMVIFGGVSLVAGLLTFFLPETLNKRLPEHFKDAVKLEPLKKKQKSDQK